MIRDWNDSTIKRFLKEGRGQGEGSAYKPWLQVQDIASQGRSTRLFCHKSQRVIHLLSDMQLYYYYLLSFDSHVTDLREQYPLLDFYELNIPIDQGLEKKLLNTKTKVPHVFTISFLITRVDQNNNPFYEARVIKTSSELEKKATIERLELQRRYFEKKNIDFGIVTEKEINKQVARNIGWVLTAYDLQDYPELMGNLELLKVDMLNLLYSNAKKTFQSIFSRLERLYQLNEGMGLILFKHLVATKQITMNMNQKIELTKKVETYDVQVPQVQMDGENHAVGS
ncbi:TnsA endonuclease C-terminal domain-containing protein [Metabacillus idriensis]|uniref:TnsA endonuclease C-terminal domain-containing protein n=1 Tax=Metabacillus idriensis TaxID=324768 RepID=UPI00174CCC2B|nr:TnsA endonuclease C-terminal domain-containing protein [Metabacillus idriensis]